MDLEARCTQIWGFRLPQVICLRRQALCQISAPRSPELCMYDYWPTGHSWSRAWRPQCEDRDNRIEQRPVRCSDKSSGWPPYAHIPISSKVPSGLATRLFESISLGVVAPQTATGVLRVGRAFGPPNRHYTLALARETSTHAIQSTLFLSCFHRSP